MSRPQSILFISNHGDVVGGGEISLLQLMCALDRTHWKPLLVVPHEGAVAKEAQDVEIATFVVPLPAVSDASTASLSSIQALRRLIYQEDARIVHANGTRAMIYGGVAARLARCLVVWHVRVMDSDGWLDRALYRLADRVVVNSDAVRQRFAWAAADRIRCIHNGVDTADFFPQQLSAQRRAQWGLKPQDPVVVSVGRFVDCKGYEDLLQAAALVHERNQAVQWVLVGDGELRSDLMNQAVRLGLRERIHFTGWLDDVREALALGDLFILPSHGEGFGRVLIEAMAMGKAVVATDVGGMPEIVISGETGVLVPPSDPDSLARAVMELVKNPALAARLGSAGLVRARREFSLSKHVAEIDRTYEELLA